jgi:hypothetical protein
VTLPVCLFCVHLIISASLFSQTVATMSLTLVSFSFHIVLGIATADTVLAGIGSGGRLKSAATGETIGQIRTDMASLCSVGYKLYSAGGDPLQSIEPNCLCSLDGSNVMNMTTNEPVGRVTVSDGCWPCCITGSLAINYPVELPVAEKLLLVTSVCRLMAARERANR